MPSFTGRAAEVTDPSATTPAGPPLTTRAPVGDACHDQWWFRKAAPGGGPDTGTGTNNNEDLLVSTQRLAGWSRRNKAAAHAPGICYEGHEFKAVAKVWTRNADLPGGGTPTSFVEFDYATIKLSTQGTSTDLCTQTLTLTTLTGFPLLLSDAATDTAGLTTIRTGTALEARHQPFTMWWNDGALSQFSPDDSDQLRIVMKEAASNFRLAGGGAGAPTTTPSSSVLFPDPTGAPTTVVETQQKTTDGLSSGALAGIIVGAVLILVLAVLVGLVLGQRRHRRSSNVEHLGQTELSASADSKGHGWGGQQGAASTRTTWLGRVLGKRESQASPSYYPTGHPSEGISAPEVVTGDHQSHYQIRSELAGLPRSEPCGDSSPAAPRAHPRPSELP
ncbi:uncharacterized protein PG986_012074 [Apiospora aurea]|uniref:Uncharacterized protein n=1 Tax=Apiospora aurea TaxID=335848 RepID=A0ABR1PYZ4_9PEZI